MKAFLVPLLGSQAFFSQGLSSINSKVPSGVVWSDCQQVILEMPIKMLNNGDTILKRQVDKLHNTGIKKTREVTALSEKDLRRSFGFSESETELFKARLRVLGLRLSPPRVEKDLAKLKKLSRKELEQAKISELLSDKNEIADFEKAKIFVIGDFSDYVREQIAYMILPPWRSQEVEMSLHELGIGLGTERYIEFTWIELKKMSKDQLMTVPVEQLPLTLRTKNVLRNFRVLKELIVTGETDLYYLNRGLGWQRITEIRSLLSNLDIQLGE